MASISPTSTVPLPPQLDGLRFRRKAVVVGNEDPGVDLWLVDAAGNRLVRIPANREITLPVSGQVGIENPTGAPVALSAGGIYWTF